MKVATSKTTTKQINEPVDNGEVKKVSRKTILCALIVFRIINCFFVRSFFQPDEFWQSLEPAHVKAFGYGQLTWEWKFGLRSYAFPFMFEIVYRAVALLAATIAFVVSINVDLFVLMAHNFASKSNFAWDMAVEMQSFPREVSEYIEYKGVIYGPKLLMAIIAAVGEFYAIRLTEKIYYKCFDRDEMSGRRAQLKKSALVLSTTNFFNCFMITRTFINSFEMDLTSIGLFYWDWTNGDCITTFNFTKSLFCGLFLCLQRPTNAFIWGPMGLFMGLNLISKGEYRSLSILFRKVILVLLSVVALNLAIDYYFYGEVFFPAFRFVKFNYTSALSEFYGTAPWHFHLSQSLPLILGYSLPLLLFGFFFVKASKASTCFNSPWTQIKSIVLINVLLFSMIKHKEFRFLYNLQPFFLVISSVVFTDFSPKKNLGKQLFRWYILIAPFLSVISSTILSSFHETGVVEVTKYLHEIPKIHSVGFMMPCHSTPWQSYIHRQDIDDIWAITCEPPLHLLSDPEAQIKLPSYMDESDHLYDDVTKFIYQNFPPVFRKKLRSPNKVYTHEWPEYLIVFQHLDEIFMKDLLKNSGYLEEIRFFNSISHWDSKRSGDVVVYYKPPWL
ncbi:LANO_0G09032g1_1 [Lachancea nothofagi CBS 11611]|uniref:Mannosyltransferase n=1 Tax=Lachancea nothofagi CBS 11611 TaxID=1266666 RepID=A0A1G4KIB9_9SACH|nr:LANO_0G09032g1_1 [Lachancea nothofagi CBS 11611]